MKIGIHPEASKSYNQRAENLVSRVRSAPENYERKQDPPNPNIHASHNLTPDDIIGEVTFGWTDLFGNVKAKAFNERGELFGLFDEDYQDLFNIAEGLQKSITPHHLIGVTRISEFPFEWIKQRYRNKTASAMVDFVLTQSEKVIQKQEIWVPISELYIQAPFVFGKVSFRAITKTDDG